jgi:hypothetical protein
MQGVRGNMRRCSHHRKKNRMSVTKQVFWFNNGKSPNVADVLYKMQESTLHRLPHDGPEADNWGAKELTMMQPGGVKYMRKEI